MGGAAVRQGGVLLRCSGHGSCQGEGERGFARQMW